MDSMPGTSGSLSGAALTATGVADRYFFFLVVSSQAFSKVPPLAGAMAGGRWSHDTRWLL